MLNGLKVVTSTLFAVILPVGITAAAAAEVGDWQHKSFVFVTLVSGANGGVKFEV